MTTSVAVFFLGGTISMAGRDGSVVARLGADELIASIPQVADLDVAVAVHDVARVPSATLRFGQVLELLATMTAAAADACVVVQGTDTLEETAFLLDLLWPGDAPLVVTGAMRNPTLPGADGPANLLAAVTVAATADARGRGALVVMNDEIHAARFVAKRHTSSTAAFVSPDLGAVGRLVEGRAVFTAGVPQRAPLPAPARIAVTVPVLVSVFDDDGHLLDRVDDGCDGLVVAGFGGGHVPDRLAERLGELAARMPVVLASRTGAGPVLTNTYGYAGSETDLIARGLVPAGRLDAVKARILLAVLLADGADVRAGFAAHAW